MSLVAVAFSTSLSPSITIPFTAQFFLELTIPSIWHFLFGFSIRIQSHQNFSNLGVRVLSLREVMLMRMSVLLGCWLTDLYVLVDVYAELKYN